jgi:hypothetical protein
MVLAAIIWLPGAFAAEGKSSDFNFGAEFRFRDILSVNPLAESGQDSSENQPKTRVKFNTTFRASERFTAYLSLMNSATWGSKDLYINNTSGYAPSAGTAVSGTTTGDSGSGVRNGTSNSDNTVLVNEAYGSWLVTDSFLLRFGRGSFTLGDGSVIATNDYQDFPYSFDGVLGTYEWEFMRLSAWAVKFAAYSSDFTGRVNPQQVFNAAGTTDSDPGASAYGLAVDWKMLPAWLKMANLHLIKNQKDQTPGTGSYAIGGNLLNPIAGMGQDTYRYGITLSGDMANVDYLFDYNAVTGNYRGNSSYQAEGIPCWQDKCNANSFMIQGVVGYTVPKWLNSHAFVVYHMDSGGDNNGSQFKTYDSYFYDIHSMTHGGLMDVIKWGNLTYYGIGYTIDPMDRFQVGLLYNMFQRTNGTATPYSINPGPLGLAMLNGNASGSAVANTKGSTSKAIGQEIDLEATKKYDGGFEVEARVGMFMPGSYIKDNIPSGTASATYTQFFLQGKMVF